MEEHEPQRTHNQEPVRLIVVEAYEPCDCHTVVTARRRDTQHWCFLFVKKPLDINFGDQILAKADLNNLFTDGLFWLDRGPNLRFRLMLDDFPEILIKKLLAEAPVAFGPDYETYQH